MLKRFTFWLWVALVFQLVTGGVHALSLIGAPAAANNTEKQLIDLMINYRLDLGGGIHRSMWDLFRALSTCFTLLCLLGGLTNIYLLRKKVDPGAIKGLVGIQLVVFAIGFAVMLVWTFLPPIIMTGLVVVFLAVAYFTTPRTSVVNS
ncbi:MAG TPA: hypothetical protein VKB46_24185 [Pyrinomonadaceae bacterium]|nr:hypothetical protein [Pyrinomonadaceae bacterium]